MKLGKLKTLRRIRRIQTKYWMAFYILSSETRRTASSIYYFKRFMKVRCHYDRLVEYACSRGWLDYTTTIYETRKIIDL